MKSAVEHLNERIEEMRVEQRRIANLKLSVDEADNFFEMHKKRDIEAIEKEISGYRYAIRILKQDKEFQHLED